MNIDAIFLIGPQGSGKGTQAKILADKLNFFHWEMGGILRAVAKEGTELGKKTKALVDQGVLLTDEQLYEVVDSRLAQIPTDTGIIFDGLPRRIAQAEHVMEYLRKQGKTNLTTLYISLPEAETMSRLLKRAQIENRADDTEEKIKFRLEQYKKDTTPVLDFLKDKTKFVEIDGTPSVEEVTQKIYQALKI
ncbi:MAG: nucleoside monophosphate kinase [Candidatus Doudnabacteria bacterium]|jgi:adenylate kinase